MEIGITWTTDNHGKQIVHFGQPLALDNKKYYLCAQKGKKIMESDLKIFFPALWADYLPIRCPNPTERGVLCWTREYPLPHLKLELLMEDFQTSDLTNTEYHPPQIPQRVILTGAISFVASNPRRKPDSAAAKIFLGSKSLDSLSSFVPLLAQLQLNTELNIKWKYTTSAHSFIDKWMQKWL